MRGRVGRIQTQGVLEACRRCCALFAQEEHIAARCMRVRAFGAQCERSVKVICGGGQVATLAKQRAEQIVRISAGRVMIERTFVNSFGVYQVAGPLQTISVP